MDSTKILTLPFDLAVQIFTEVVNTDNAGWQGVDEKSKWTIGHSTDPETGMEFIQISVEPLLVVVKE